MSHLVYLVIRGKKPGCYVSKTKKVINLAKRHGLDIIDTKPYTPWKTKSLACIVVAKKEKVKYVLARTTLPCIPQLQRRMKKLVIILSNKSVTEALAYINAYPRKDRIYKKVEKWNLERPEMATLEGILLGYPSCCIEYYINTRYLGKREGAHEEERYVQCYHCAHPMY